jgi:hypothetical protein
MSTPELAPHRQRQGGPPQDELAVVSAVLSPAAVFVAAGVAKGLPYRADRGGDHDPAVLPRPPVSSSGVRAVPVRRGCPAGAVRSDGIGAPAQPLPTVDLGLDQWRAVIESDLNSGGRVTL